MNHLNISHEHPKELSIDALAWRPHASKKLMQKTHADKWAESLTLVDNGKCSQLLSLQVSVQKGFMHAKIERQDDEVFCMLCSPQYYPTAMSCMFGWLDFSVVQPILVQPENSSFLIELC